MTTGVVKTQGTELFLIDTISTPGTPAIVKMACPTGISGLGGAADQIEDTCLDALTDKTYQRGLGNPGQVTVPFNLVPRDVSHQLLFDMKDDGSVFRWMVALSESNAAPTLTAGAFVAPTTRSSLQFDAYISDINIDVATNEIVRGTMTLQRSGAVVATWYEPA
jgi:hypothetical protein